MVEHRLFSFKKENVYDSAPASHCWEFVLQMKWRLSKSQDQSPLSSQLTKQSLGPTFRKSALTHRYFRLIQYFMFQPSLANDEESLKKCFFPKILQRWFGKLVYLPFSLSPSFLRFLLSFSPPLLSHSLSHAEPFSRPW